MGRAFVCLVCMLVATPALANQRERVAIIAVDLAGGAPEFMRAKALTGVTEGLKAAGFDVVPLDHVISKLTGNLGTCRQGPCTATVGKTLGVSTLVMVSITRKDESTVIVMRQLDAATGDALADVHEVCDLCGQNELEERINVAASALRVKAEAERQRRADRLHSEIPRPGSRIRVGIVPALATIDVATADSLASDLADALAQELDIDAIGGLEVRRRLPAGGIPDDCHTTPACIGDVARKLGTNQLLFVVMVQTSGGGVQIDSTWIEPATGRSAARRPIDVAVVSGARAKFAASAKLLLPDAPVRKQAGGGGGGFDGKMSSAVPRHLTTPAYIAGGAAIVGLGVGIAFGVSARGKYNDCEQAGICDQSKKDSIRSATILADVGFVLAVAGAATAGILYATSGKESQLIVAPVATPGGAGMFASGRF